MEERPIECSSCKRKGCISYKKITNGEIQSSQMCSMCPILQKNIGVPFDDELFNNINLDLDRKCKNCHTSLHDLTISGIIGCSLCYQEFEEFLVDELSDSGKIPLKKGSPIVKKRSIPIHLGASPELLRTEDVTKKLESLQSALTDAVKDESYERAAYLRDQIKILTEKNYGKERKAS